ncbi:hypothetical protein HanRHA438_Chr03g0140141 [Helianthus annuus]|nr:hypothetical protein HanRHA438_Chr03g0140141 [Helianthus annuus]
MDSKKKLRLGDNDGFLGEFIVLLGTLSWPVVGLGDGKAAAMLLMPHHGTATVAFSEKKLSLDKLLLAFVTSLSELMWFHM